MNFNNEIGEAVNFCPEHHKPMHNGLCPDCITLLAKDHKQMMAQVEKAKRLTSGNPYFDADDWGYVETVNYQPVFN